MWKPVALIFDIVSGFVSAVESEFSALPVDTPAYRFLFSFYDAAKLAILFQNNKFPTQIVQT